MSASADNRYRQFSLQSRPVTRQDSFDRIQVDIINPWDSTHADLVEEDMLLEQCRVALDEDHCATTDESLYDY